MDEREEGLRTVSAGSPRGDTSITLVVALGLLSVFAGVAGGVLGLTVAYLFGAPEWGKFIMAGITFGLVAAFTFSFFKLFFLIEMWFGLDLNRDGQIGDVPTAPMLPATVYKTPVWVRSDPENPANASRVDVPAPRDDTLERMAVILARRGWGYFTAENFTSSKSETKLMSYDNWHDTFLPKMIEAGLVSTTADSRGRNRLTLTDAGRRMMTQLAGAAGETETKPVTNGSASVPVVPTPSRAIYAQESPALPRYGVFDASRRQKQYIARQSDRQAGRRT